jgi:hypothetical protein
MEQRPEPHSPVWLFPFSPQDWAQTPLAVQASLCTVRDALDQLQDRVATLEARLKQHSKTASQPPSSDAHSKKTRQRTASITSHKAGGKLGHRGHRRVLCTPLRVQELRPTPWACVSTACGGRVLVEVPRWCQRTKAPPTGGAWRMWYVRLGKWPIGIMITRTKQGDTHAGCHGRWMRCGYFGHTTASRRSTTGPSKHGAIGSCGARARMGRPVRRAIGGWSAACLCRRPAVCEPCPPLMSSWRL